MKWQQGSGWRGALAAAIATAAALLAGCASVPLPPDDGGAGQPSPVVIVDSAVPALPPAGSGRGGYYMDDGPGDAPPERLLETPDAEPRIEPYAKATLRPYVVFGKTYTPISDERPYKERGHGSWYGKKFHGQKTASGELYDMYQMTAAHPTLPLPSYVRVTNVENGRQVIVRVNDRGPFLAGRIIDLSYTAALKLGYLEKGSALLEVERLLPDEIRRMNQQRTVQAAQPAAPVAPEGAAIVEAVAGSELPARTALPEAPQLVSAPVVSAGPLQLASPGAPAGPSAPGIWLQLGAFGQQANAEAARNRLLQQAGALQQAIEVVEQGGIYRVYGGPYLSREQAETAADAIRPAIGQTPLIVQR